MLENVVFDPETRIPDYDDGSITENTRACYPIEHIDGALIPCVGGHPRHIIFLTCDAFGVLPPVSRLTPAQAMYHFLSGYTAKVAGTEVGISEPQVTFSACFGAAFLVLHPVRYAEMLSERIERHRSAAWLINTGWTGGPHGVGSRIKLTHTRAIIDAIHDDSLKLIPTRQDPIFGLHVPTSCPGLPAASLTPRETWADPEAYDRTGPQACRPVPPELRPVCRSGVRGGPPGRPAGLNIQEEGTVMASRRSLTPQLESLESKALMSASRTVVLTGMADGFYTSSQTIPDTGTDYQLTATGTLPAFGEAAVTGSFQTPGFIRNGQTTGTLKVAVPSGTLTLRLTATGQGIANVATGAGHHGHPARPDGRGSASVVGEPIILLYDFNDTIIKGTGRYAHARGSGRVEITTTPGVTEPSGPGIYNSGANLITGSGRLTVSFFRALPHTHQT